MSGVRTKTWVDSDFDAVVSTFQLSGQSLFEIFQSTARCYYLRHSLYFCISLLCSFEKNVRFCCYNSSVLGASHINLEKWRLHLANFRSRWMTLLKCSTVAIQIKAIAALVHSKTWLKRCFINVYFCTCKDIIKTFALSQEPGTRCRYSSCAQTNQDAWTMESVVIILHVCDSLLIKT